MMDSSNFNEKFLLGKKDIFICKNCNVNTKYNSSSNKQPKYSINDPFIKK